MSKILAACCSPSLGESTPLGDAKDAVNHDTIAGAYFGDKCATMLTLRYVFSDIMSVASLVFCDEIVNCICDIGRNDEMQI